MITDEQLAVLERFAVAVSAPVAGLRASSRDLFRSKSAQASLQVTMLRSGVIIAVQTRGFRRPSEVADWPAQGMPLAMEKTLPMTMRDLGAGFLGIISYVSLDNVGQLFDLWDKAQLAFGLKADSVEVSAQPG
jgi:hypothetical protein